MKVNEEKTALLCVSTHPFTQTSSYITSNNMTIESSTFMRMFGFVFGDHGGMSAHVDHICIKFGMRIWSLRHLKLAKMDTKLMISF